MLVDRAPYVSGLHLQNQSYMPVFISPSQSLISAHGWSTYMGNMSTVSSAAILGSGFAYNSMNRAKSGPDGQVLSSSTYASHFPESPDQPECLNFMNTGTCKYGSDCKYHHTKGRAANSAVNITIGPVGLPSRPGQAACPSYTTFGLYKHSSTCRLDHPFVGYPYNF